MAFYTILKCPFLAIRKYRGYCETNWISEISMSINLFNLLYVLPSGLVTTVNLEMIIRTCFSGRNRCLYSVGSSCSQIQVLNVWLNTSFWSKAVYSCKISVKANLYSLSFSFLTGNWWHIIIIIIIMFGSHGIMSIRYITVIWVYVGAKLMFASYNLSQIHIRDIQQAVAVRKIYGYLLHNKSLQILLCSCIYILLLFLKLSSNELQVIS